MVGDFHQRRLPSSSLIQLDIRAVTWCVVTAYTRFRRRYGICLLYGLCRHVGRYVGFMCVEIEFEIEIILSREERSLPI